jgi:hypothetical protein
MHSDRKLADARRIAENAARKLTLEDFVAWWNAGEPASSLGEGHNALRFAENVKGGMVTAICGTFDTWAAGMTTRPKKAAPFACATDWIDWAIGRCGLPVITDLKGRALLPEGLDEILARRALGKCVQSALRGGWFATLDESDQLEPVIAEGMQPRTHRGPVGVARRSRERRH